jgi:hypothetical protein
MGLGLADEADDETDDDRDDDVPVGFEVLRWCPVRTLDAYQRLVGRILVGTYSVPPGAAMQAPAGVHAATRPRWKQRRRLRRNPVPR